MDNKKLYIWQLASFLHQHSTTMSGEELAEHLNRNQFLTGYGAEYAGGRGTYKLISEVHKWLTFELKMAKEAEKVEKVFVKSDGTYAYE